MFKASPFLVGDDCVSIMNGTDEGRVARSSLCDEAGLVRPLCAGLCQRSERELSPGQTLG